MLTAGAVSASPLAVAGADDGDAALSQAGYDAYRGSTQTCRPMRGS